MAEVGAFREFQTRSTILAERERALENRRLAVQELRQTISNMQVENRAREEKLSAERARFTHKKSMQDEKVGAKDSQARAQQDRVARLAEEEDRLTKAIAQCDEQIDTTANNLERRQELEVTLREAKESLTKLKFQLEEKDAKMMKLETRLARQEMATDKRHSALADRVPQCYMPRVTEADKGTGLEYMAGESVLLVDEMN